MRVKDHLFSDLGFLRARLECNHAHLSPNVRSRADETNIGIAGVRLVYVKQSILDE